MLPPLRLTCSQTWVGKNPGEGGEREGTERLTPFTLYTAGNIHITYLTFNFAFACFITTTPQAVETVAASALCNKKTVCPALLCASMLGSIGMWTFSED